MSEKPGDSDTPFIITPEEFGELDDYTTISLTYFADNVLADENDEKISDYDIESMIGSESLEHFGDYEDDSVFVRNDKLKCDYEILKDNMRWVDIVNPPKVKQRVKQYDKPHQMEA